MKTKPLTVVHVVALVVIAGSSLAEGLYGAELVPIVSQMIVGLAAAAIVPTGVMVRLCLWYPLSAWLVLSIYTAVAIVALIIVEVVILLYDLFLRAPR